MIITAIHEIFGNFLKNYYYYLTKFYISDVFPIKDGKNEEDAYFVEDLLFNGIEKKTRVIDETTPLLVIAGPMFVELLLNIFLNNKKQISAIISFLRQSK